MSKNQTAHHNPLVTALNMKRDKYQALFDDFEVKTGRILGGLKKGTPAYDAAHEKATSILTTINTIIETCEQTRRQLEKRMTTQVKSGMAKMEDLEKDLKDLIGPLKSRMPKKDTIPAEAQG